jgi:hypothetical protein
VPAAPLGDRPSTPVNVWFEPAHGVATLHGIVPARGSGATLEPDQPPRLASGTSPVVDLTNTPFTPFEAKPEPRPEKPTTATGMSSYAATNWNTVVIALVIAMIVITITFLL